MGFAFNPFTGNFDQTGSGGGGGGSAFFAGEVATYADLPLDGTAALDSRWLVRSNSGTWPFSSYKQAGVYVRSATVGANRDDDYTLTDTSFHDVMSDDAFLIFDNTDPTKAAKFDVGTNVSAGQTRTLSIPDSSGTIALTSDFAAPPAIGNTTPAAGSFTTLSASTSLTLGTSGILSGGTNTVEQRNTTSGQTFRIYNTVSGTADANFERGFMRWSSNVLQIGTEAAGTGSARNLEFQTGGTTRFSISATAAVLNVGGGAFDAVIGRPNAGVLGFARADGATTYIAALGFDGTTRALVANSAAFIGWSNGNASSVSAGDTRFWRDAAGIVAQRNGATGQAFRIYNTDGTNFERLNLRWASNEFVIDAEKGGTGTLRGIKIGSATSSLLGFYGVTPVDQPATVADPAGGGTVDTEARTAINAVIDRLQELGLIA